MNKTMENRDDFCSLVLAELKTLGVKVPKAKKLKQERNGTASTNRIFGVRLCDQEFVSESGSVLPKFVVEATTYLRRYSEVAVGLFRKVGSISRQRILRDKLEKGESLEGSEPNDVAALLKQWLRELPEPLIPSYLYDLLIKCINLETPEKRTSATLLSCLLLGPENLFTLKHLLQFLADIAANSDKNMMDLHNLAVIIGPNLLSAENSGLDNLNEMLLKVHTSLIELLIEICPKFGEIPDSISSQFDENISFDNLDFSIDAHLSPSKSKKKLKGASVQDILSGIRKLVGQPWTPAHDSRMMNPHSTFTSRSASKRKADRDPCLLSPAKKQALSKSTVDNIEENIGTPGKGTNGKKHSRVRSFNLLKKKERKSHRTPNSKPVNKKPSPKIQAPVVNTRTEKPDQLQHNFLKVQATSSKQSSSVSAKSEYLSVPAPGIRKSISDCVISTSLHEFRDTKKIIPSTSQGNLPNKPKRLSPHNLSPTRPKRCKRDVHASIDKIKKPNLEGKSMSTRSNILTEGSRKTQDVNNSDKNLKSNQGNAENFKKGTNSKKSSTMRESSVTDIIKDTTIENVFVAGSSKRLSARKKLKMNKPLLSQNSSIKCGSQIETTLQRQKNISGENATSAEVGNISLNGTLKSNASIRKNKIESLKREPSLTRRNSSRRRKREVTHVKSLDSSTSNQFKRSAITNRSLKVKGKTSSGSEKCKGEAENTFSNEDSSQCTPQKNYLLRRETKSSLRRGRPNTIKSGLPSELCPRYNNTATKPTGEKPDVDNVKTSVVLGDMDTDYNNLESMFDAKTLLDDICDTLNNFILNENVKDLTQDSQTECQIHSQKNDNVCIVPTRYFTRYQVKRNSLSHIDTHLGNAQANLKLDEKVTQKLSSSDSKIHVTRKSSEFKRSSHNSVLIKNESKSKENNKKWSNSSFDDLNINPLLKTESNKIKLNCTDLLNDCECSDKNKLIDDNTKTVSCDGDKSLSGRNENPSTWISGEIFFDNNTLKADTVNKRESIAQILKNNSGNVLAKVHQFDYVTKSPIFKTPELPFEKRQSSLKCFKTPLSANMSSRRSSSQKHFKTPISGTTSSRKDSSVKFTKSRRQVAPPPKFVIPDSSPVLTDMDNLPSEKLTNTIAVKDTQVLNQSPSSMACNTQSKDRTTPKDSSTVSHPLKELTNITIIKDNSKTPTQASPICQLYSTPMEDQENTPIKSTLEPENTIETKRKSNRIKSKRNSYSGHTPFKLTVQFSRSESSPMLDKKYV